MNKWTSSKIVNVAFSFLLALLITAYVLSTKPSYSGSNNNQYTSLLPEKKATITSPLTVQFNSSDYVIVGAPSSVGVTLQGSSALVTAAQSHNEIQAVADLRGLGVGQHTVNVALTGVSSSLTATASPQTVTVTLAEKDSAKKDVQVQYDDSKIASGYQVTNTTVDPKTVTITGPKENVDAVDHVGADVALNKSTKSNVTQSTKLTAYDKNGDAVQVTLSQQTAQVSMTISSSGSSSSSSSSASSSSSQSSTSGSSSTTKKVSLVGQASAGSTDNFNISFSPSSVTIAGSSDTLSSIDSLPVSLDLSNITSKVTKTVSLTKPSGVDSLSDQSVQVTISPKS
ncbi:MULTISPECIES: CdaR family protein [Fructobacillus]|uniref:YbbR-like protein n=2 Tax=Fructobacillus TaxID=559173 RepID=A0A3F3HEQ9_9LACO|nr:CdaR family protein [Fructobacillus tropaeoli]CAK1252567.1 Cyclic di-AMP synthase regulator CdaR [Fructobacillus sp. LMG 32999]NLS37589.1 hypothetical protein [Fructobacillus tropaeoli]CAK1225983.1 Cyclic di-AMP synthase regulator CdaR [Fructobacillus tropaeoli]CAK1235675.1 Cyclic di-AMP synthase regulator CdaR [Fructobacillus tropaeoli]CAK1253413.1 Cyclic di-AMP synthase regulator CdaR [Fructobacillus sp. LMG 32999]